MKRYLLYCLGLVALIVLLGYAADIDPREWML
jgi:hypothetical protein